MDQILLSLSKIKSAWELLYEIPTDFENVHWNFVLPNLTQLFRKDTFFELIHTKKYYPQPTQNCRYYIKPNEGSCGKGIQVVNELPSQKIVGHTICPEIITPLISIENMHYKYDYRVWIGIDLELNYFVCPTIIRRVSTVPFSLDTAYGSITNTSLYSEQFDHTDSELYEKINCIVKDILTNLKPLKQIEPLSDKKYLMLTGWDFIENKFGELFVLEVNCNPSINILHKQVMTEFLNWIVAQKD